MPKMEHAATPASGEHGEHLLQNRPVILLRSLLVGMSGALPVPPLDEMLAQALRRGLLRKVAQSRSVDIDEAALDVLCAEDPTAKRLSTASAIGAALAALRPFRLTRRLFAGVLILRQADEAMRTYQQATLFDHYC